MTEANEFPLSYDQLLDRMFTYRQSETTKKKYKIKPPKVVRAGAKKTAWENCIEICQSINRSEIHVSSFLFVELGTDGSFDGEKKLQIKGKYQPKHIAKIIQRYISEYVVCPACNSLETTLIKKDRLDFLHCQKCESDHAVKAIKKGFEAQIGKRRLMKK